MDGTGERYTRDAWSRGSGRGPWYHLQGTPEWSSVRNSRDTKNRSDVLVSGLFGKKYLMGGVPKGILWFNLSLSFELFNPGSFLGEGQSTLSYTITDYFYSNGLLKHLDKGR